MASRHSILKTPKKVCLDNSEILRTLTLNDLEDVQFSDQMLICNCMIGKSSAIEYKVNNSHSKLVLIRILQKDIYKGLLEVKNFSSKYVIFRSSVKNFEDYSGAFGANYKTSIYPSKWFLKPKEKTVLQITFHFPPESIEAFINKSNYTPVNLKKENEFTKEQIFEITSMKSIVIEAFEVKGSIYNLNDFGLYLPVLKSSRLYDEYITEKKAKLLFFNKSREVSHPSMSSFENYNDNNPQIRFKHYFTHHQQNVSTAFKKFAVKTIDDRTNTGRASHYAGTSASQLSEFEVVIKEPNKEELDAFNNYYKVLCAKSSESTSKILNENHKLRKELSSISNIIEKKTAEIIQSNEISNSFCIIPKSSFEAQPNFSLLEAKIEPSINIKLAFSYFHLFFFVLVGYAISNYFF